MVRLELVARGVRLVILLLRPLWHGLQAMPHRVFGVLVLPLRGRVQATSDPSCPTSVPQAPSPGFATRESSLAEWLSQLSQALPGCCKAAGFSLKPHALSPFWTRCRLSFLCCLSGVGLFCSADLLINRRHHCMWSWVTCLRDDPSSVFWIERPKVFPFTRTGTRCIPESVCRSIQEPLLPDWTSAPLCVSFPTLTRGLLTSLKGV